MDPQPASISAESTTVVPPVSQPEKEKPVTKSEYSGIGIIIAIMLTITLVVFVQYVIGDLRETYAGKEPQMDTYFQYQQGSGSTTYLDKSNGTVLTYQDAQTFFDKTYRLPYESQKLLISTFVNVPIFIFSIALLLAKGRMRNSLRLGVNALFAATIFNMLRLLAELGTFAFTLNQKLTMYGVSFILIVVFFGSIIYIQDRHNKASSETS